MQDNKHIYYYSKVTRYCCAVPGNGAERMSTDEPRALEYATRLGLLSAFVKRWCDRMWIEDLTTFLWPAGRSAAPATAVVPPSTRVTEVR